MEVLAENEPETREKSSKEPSLDPLQPDVLQSPPDCPKTPPITSPQNRSSPKIFVSLKSPNETQCRSPINPEIVDSLLSRKQQKVAKINKMRVEKIANEISQLQSIPTINKNSKKIINKVPEKSPEVRTLKLTPDEPVKTHEKAIQEHAVFDNSDLIKSTLQLRVNLPVKQDPPEPKHLSLEQRNKMTKEKKLKKIKEAEALKKVREVEGCTFKPTILSTKNQISESGTCIYKRSDSGSMLKSDLGSPSSPRANRAVLEFFDNFQLREARTFNMAYSQVSPVDYSLRHQTGYSQAIEARSHPMVDYRVVGQNLLD